MDEHTKQVVVQALGTAVGATMLLNGFYAAAAPRKWVQSKWTLSGSIGTEDVASTTGRVQIRVLGLVFIVAAGIVLSATFEIGSEESIRTTALILFAIAWFTGLVLLLVKPEQSVFHIWRTVLSHLPPPEFRIVVRVSAVLVAVVCLAAVIKSCRSTP